MRKRVGKVSLDILSELNIGKEKKRFKVICGYKVKMNSQRYAVFKKSLSCAYCGIEGSFFAIEQDSLPTDHYYLNLYAVDKNGREVLMTKDHIQSKASGGKSILANYQTMCVDCNCKKGSKTETEELKEEIKNQILI